MVPISWKSRRRPRQVLRWTGTGNAATDGPGVLQSIHDVEAVVQVLVVEVALQFLQPRAGEAVEVAGNTVRPVPYRSSKVSMISVKLGWYASGMRCHRLSK